MVRQKFIDRLWKEFFFEDKGRLFFFVLTNLLYLLVIGCPVWLLVTDSVENDAIPATFLLFGGLLIGWLVYLGLSVFFTLHKTQYPLMYAFFKFFRRD